MPSPSLVMRPLNRLTMLLVGGVRGFVWQYCATQRGASFSKGRGETAAIVGQHVGEPEGEGGSGLAQEGNGAFLGFVVFDGEVDGA